MNSNAFNRTVRYTLRKDLGRFGDMAIVGLEDDNQSKAWDRKVVFGVAPDREAAIAIAEVTQTQGVWPKALRTKDVSGWFVLEKKEEREGKRIVLYGESTAMLNARQGKKLMHALSKVLEEEHFELKNFGRELIYRLDAPEVAWKAYGIGNDPWAKTLERKDEPAQEISFGVAETMHAARGIAEASFYAEGKKLEGMDGLAVHVKYPVDKLSASSILSSRMLGGWDASVGLVSFWDFIARAQIKRMGTGLAAKF